MRRLHAKFPEFLAGFDLVGQEDVAPGLISFAEQILKLPSDLKFFFHAGETNWFGSVDENLVIIIIFIFYFDELVILYFLLTWIFSRIFIRGVM